jgi:Fe-S-cluster containining protein
MKSTPPTLPPDALPMLSPIDVCPSCTKCCRYVAVGIDPPDSIRRISTILWFLYHNSISIYQSHDNDWFIVFPTTCENLQPNGLCGIYENRPLICREYDIVGCEGTSQEAPEKVKFENAKQLFHWLSKTRPALYKRCVERGIVPARLKV